MTTKIIMTVEHCNDVIDTIANGFLSEHHSVFTKDAEYAEYLSKEIRRKKDEHSKGIKKHLDSGHTDEYEEALQLARKGYEESYDNDERRIQRDYFADLIDRLGELIRLRDKFYIAVCVDEFGGEFFGAKTLDAYIKWCNYESLDKLEIEEFV